MADSIPTAWRTAPADASRPRRRWLALLLLALVAVAGSLFGMVLWLSPPRPVAIEHIGITTEPPSHGIPGVVPWTAQDRAAILDVRLSRTPIDSRVNPSRDQIRLRLKALAALPAKQPLVVYFSAPANLDGAGQVYLLGADPIGDHPRNRIAISEVLELIRLSPARHRLVVLDLWPMANRDVLAPPAGEVSQAIIAALDAVPDEKRLCLLSCDAGQVPLASPVLGKSLFGYYVALGLHGAADGWNPETNRDGRVNVSELAAFAKRHMHRWSELAGGTVQTPRLFGNAADFTLYPATLSETIAYLEQSTTPLGAYPDWLKTAWANEANDRDRLLRAEQAWANGMPGDAVQREWEKANRPAIHSSNTPSFTLASLPLATQIEASKIADELKLALAKMEAAPPAPAPGLAKDLEPFKAKTHDATAVAVITILMQDPALAASRVKTLDLLLTTQQPTPRFEESLLLRRLAEVDASPALVAQMLRLGSDFEQAVQVLASSSTALPALDDAYRRWRSAQAAVFSPGFISQALTADRLSNAGAAIRQVKTFAEATMAAEIVRKDALHTLAAAYPAFLAGQVSQPSAERVAEQSNKLNQILFSHAPSTRDSIAAATEERLQRTAELREALAALRRPFSPMALAALRERASASDATVAMARELGVLLNTDLVPAVERPALWETYLSLEKRFSEEVTRLDREEIRASRVTDYRDPREPGNERTTGTLDRQESWARLQLLAGRLDDRTPGDVATSRTPIARLEQLRKQWLETLAIPAVADARTRIQWQARRYSFEAHDAIGPGSDAEGVAFATDAGRTFRTLAPTVRGDEFIAFTNSVAPIQPGVRGTVASPGFRLVGTSAAPPVRLEAFTRFPDWLQVDIPQSLELKPGLEQSAKLAIRFGDAPPESGAKGVLIEATLGDRTYHHRLPMNFDVMANALQLVVTNDPKSAPREAKEILLRPHGEVVPYLFSLSNPGPNAKGVIVRLATLGVETKPFVLAGRSQESLAFPPPIAPAPVAGQPADTGFRNLTQPLVFEVLEAEGRKRIQTFEVPVTLLDPSRYLTVTDVSYRPAIGGRPNSLSVRLRPESPLGPPPCTVEVVLPEEANPSLMIRDGKLKSPIPADGSPLRLYAEGLTVGGAAPSQLYVTLTADGSERAFLFAGTLPSTGEAMRLSPDLEPKVRVRAAEYASGIQPLTVRVEVDNAPEGSHLEMRLGTEVDGRFVPDASKTIESPRERLTAIGVKAPEGMLLFRGLLRDWSTTLPVEYLVGIRDLEAKLVDDTGKVLASSRVKVTFDSVPPANIAFLSVPPKVAKEKPLTVRATADKPVSGMKEVKFFVGKPVKGEAPPNTPTVAGKLIDPVGNVWEATLPAPAVDGPITLSALFTSKAGLTGVGTQDAESLPEAEANKPEPATIAGKVVEGTLPQGGLTVVLSDAKGEKGRVKTKPDGSYQFSDVPPGKYKLLVEKESTSRKAEMDVDVKAGETKSVTLELFL